MKAPVLNRRLVLEARGQVGDGAGGYVDGWTALGTLWGEVSLRSGRGASGADLALGRMSYRIRVRAAPVGAPDRPQPGQRFRDGARLFLIRAVSEEDTSGRFLRCYAEEELAA